MKVVKARHHKVQGDAAPQTSRKHQATRKPDSVFTRPRGGTQQLDPDAPRRLTLNKHELGELLLSTKKPGVIDAPGVPRLPSMPGKLLVVNKGVAPDWDAQKGDPRPKGDHSSLMVMDLTTGELAREVKLHDQSHEIAIGPDGHTAVIPHYRWTVPEHGRQKGSAVTVLDVKTDEQHLVEIPGYTGSHGLAWIDEDHIAITADAHEPDTEKSFLLELNVRTRKIERVIPTEQEESHLVQLSADKKTYYVTDLEGRFSAIDRATGKVKKSVATGAGTEGFAITPDGKEVWIAARLEDKISVLDAKTLETRATLRSEGGPIRVLFTPDGKHALVTNRGGNSVGVFDARTGLEVKHIDLKVPRLAHGSPQVKTSSGAMMIAVNEAGHTAFVGNSHSGVVTAFDTRTWELSGFLKAGFAPDPLALLP